MHVDEATKMQVITKSEGNWEKVTKKKKKWTRFKKMEDDDWHCI